MSRVIVVGSNGGRLLGCGSVNRVRLSLPFRGEAGVVSDDKRRKWPPIQRLGRAPAVAAWSIAPLQQATLEEVDVAIDSRLGNQELHSFGSRLGMSVGLREVWRRRAVVNLPTATEIGKSARRELRAAICGENSRNNSVREPAAEGMDDVQRRGCSAEFGDARPTSVAICIDEELSSLT